MTALILLHSASGFVSLNSGKCLDFLITEGRGEYVEILGTLSLFFRIKLWHKCYYKSRLLIAAVTVTVLGKAE